MIAVARRCLLKEVIRVKAEALCKYSTTLKNSEAKHVEQRQKYAENRLLYSTTDRFENSERVRAKPAKSR